MTTKGISGSQNSQIEVPEIFWVDCNELQVDEFFTTFNNTIEVFEEEVEYLGMNDPEDSITSSNMNDCITIFGVEFLNGKKEQLSAYHVKSGTDSKEIIEEYLSGFKDCEKCHFFIVGGNDASTQNGDLASTITSTLSNFFKNKANWEFKTFLNRLKGSGLTYTSANLHKDGRLSYCLHNDLR